MRMNWRQAVVVSANRSRAPGSAPAHNGSVRHRTDGKSEKPEARIVLRSGFPGVAPALRRLDSPAQAVSLVPATAGLTLAGDRLTGQRKASPMLYTIAVVLLILWLLGLVTSYTLGGFIHILLVVAIVMVLLNLISGRRSV